MSLNAVILVENIKVETVLYFFKRSGSEPVKKNIFYFSVRALSVLTKESTGIMMSWV